MLNFKGKASVGEAGMISVEHRLGFPLNRVVAPNLPGQAMIKGLAHHK